VARAVLSITDFTERRARDLTLRRLAGIMETTQDAVIAADQTGHITIWNRGAEVLFGHSESEALGLPIRVLCPDDRREEQAAAFEALQSGASIESYDTIRQTKDGRRIAVTVSYAVTRNEAGEFEGVAAVIRDTSHQQDLQAALERARTAAETASQLKSEFLANMSHEIRTPLNGVVGMADLLGATLLNAEQQRYVATLLEASQALRVIVDDVLDFSKIEAGQLAIENVEFDLVALATGAVDMFRHAGEEAGTRLFLQLPASAPLRVLGDPNRIRQVLINLINNAVKFTRNGKIDVRISIERDFETSLSIRAEIEDTGVGISREAKTRLFQPFAQADGSITRQFGGTGLGLSICKKLLELMDGRIGFASEPGTGSTFWFELTVGKAKTSGTRRGAPVSSVLPINSSGWRILVAEDNAINQKVVGAMLQGLGCRVDIANNGREALELWKHGIYDLILMDCQMPELSGFEVTIAIRQIEGKMRTPIIAMTAQAYAEDRQRCADAGMDDHLAKPLTKSELRSILAKWLRLQSAAPIEAAPPASRGTGVDVRALTRLQEELGEGGGELLTSLIDSFLAEFPKELARVDELIAAGDWQPVPFEVHRLRSSTSNLSAIGLSELCKELEEGAGRKDAELAQRLSQSLKLEFVRAQSMLLGFCRSTRARTSTEERRPQLA
jgi:PAS domain S-box-containing protein